MIILIRIIRVVKFTTSNQIARGELIKKDPLSVRSVIADVEIELDRVIREGSFGSSKRVFEF